VSNKKDSVQQVKHPRILLGIFSMDSIEEFNRRRLIRKTYLSAYQILADIGLSQGSHHPHRICSLAELLNTTESQMESFEDCGMAYTFVIGAHGISANTSAPTELLEDHAPYTLPAGTEMSVADHDQDTAPEGDVTYLNIRENMNEGKTLTWFKYASTALPDTLNIDLIVKVDTDTVVFPRSFLEELHEEMEQQQMMRPARAVYGGLREVAATGFPLDVVPFYMQGGFYFLSKDLAQDVTSNSCKRSPIIQRLKNVTGYRAEDREMGSFVNQCATTSRTGKVARLVLPYRSAKHHWRHKVAANFRVAWKDALAKDVARLRYREIQRNYNGCPPTQEAFAAEMSWFDQRQNMKQAQHQLKNLISKDCEGL